LRRKTTWGLAAACALILAAPAAASFPDYPGEPRHAVVAADGFARPLDGPLHSRFGYRWGRLHSGLDIAILGTDRVHAALPGIVDAVGYLNGYSGYGNVVRIRHEDGMRTLYAHLSSSSVKVGQWVDRGELIARAGCTGSCTGPHLHFEVRIRGRAVDPLPFLRDQLR
jgi:murein DD-endopeptidase MepM/ murein hydrolase activator NlpD